MKKPEPRQVYDYDEVSEYLYEKYGEEASWSNPSIYYFDYYFGHDEQSAEPFVVVDFQEVINDSKNHSKNHYDAVIGFAKVILEEFQPENGIMAFY